MVSLWPTVGQPLANQDTIGLLGHQDTLLLHGQPLANQDTTGPLGHQDTLLPHGQPLANCWPTVGQPGHHWPSWPPGHSAALWSAFGQLLANRWPTIGTFGPLGHQDTLLPHGQPLANQDTTGPLGHQDTLLLHGQPLANCWPTIGQPGHHWPSWPPGHSAASWSAFGQLLANHWPTRTPLALLATRTHCCLMANRWPTRTPLALLATRTLCCLMVSLWSTVGQPLANQDTTGLLGHQDTLLLHGQPLVNCWPTVGQPEHHWPSWSPGHTAASWSTIGQTGHHCPSWPPGHPAASWSPCWPLGPSPQSCFP
ncbi:uncharacterized protein LOC124417692 [Gallus gallus]|uniref:uncharacterized protein LOC124417692 n=1 Tax=Gallus gallus TaxID=9031 RepID=UPI001F021AF0|nr:uncharacterized protein LOC124417692 [Gallus gallus]